jgi:hypothetical protein
MPLAIQSREGQISGQDHADLGPRAVLAGSRSLDPLANESGPTQVSAAKTDLYVWHETSTQPGPPPGKQLRIQDLAHPTAVRSELMNINFAPARPRSTLAGKRGQVSPTNQWMHSRIEGAQMQLQKLKDLGLELS